MACPPLTGLLQLLLLSPALPGVRPAWRGGVLGEGGSWPFSSETRGGGSREPPSPSLPRSHMEPAFFQHGGKGNSVVWLAGAAPHPLSSRTPGSHSLLGALSPLSRRQRGLCALRVPHAPAGQSPGAELAKAPFNSVTSSTQTWLPSAGLGPWPALCAWNLPPRTRFGVPIVFLQPRGWLSSRPRRQQAEAGPGVAAVRGYSGAQTFPAPSTASSLAPASLAPWFPTLARPSVLRCFGVYCRGRGRNFGPRRLVELFLLSSSSSLLIKPGPSQPADPSNVFIHSLLY